MNHQDDSSKPQRLPETAKRLIEIVGYDTAMQIINLYGGVDVVIPARPRPGQVLAKKIGMEAVEKLSFVYGGDRLYIPRCTAVNRAERDQKILADYDADKSVRQLAMEHNLTERRIRDIINSPAPGS